MQMAGAVARVVVAGPTNLHAIKLGSRRNSILVVSAGGVLLLLVMLIGITKAVGAGRLKQKIRICRQMMDMW